MNTMAKQGLTYQQIMSGGIDTVYKVAAANQQDLETTANVVSDVYNEMGDIFKKSGMSAQQAADQIGNSMTVALHHARISMDDFMNALKYVGPQASAAGIGIKDVSTAVALLGEHGIRGTQAGTTLRTMLTNLTPVSKAAATQMQDLGMITKNGANIFYDASGKMKPLAEVQQILHDKLSKLNPEMEQLAIKTIFGRYALSGMTALVGTAPSKFQELNQAMNNNNTMTDIMKEKSQGLGMQLEMLNAHWQTIQKTIGEALKPIVESLIGSLNGLMKAWQGLNPHVQQFLIVSAAVTGVVLLIGGALLGLVGTIGMFAQAWGAGLVVLGAIATPALIVIGVIAAIGVAIAGLSYVWSNNLGGIQQKAQAVWTWVSAQFSTAMSAISKVVSEGVQTVIQWWDQMAPTFSKVVQEIYDYIVWLKPLWQAMWEACKVVVETAFNLIVNIVKTSWGVISNVISMIANILTGQWGAAWNNAKNLVINAINMLLVPIHSLPSNIMSSVSTIGSSLASYFGNLGNLAASWGANLVHMLANGITGAMGAVTSAVSSVASKVAGFLAWHSPTKEGPGADSDKWAPNFISMMAKGIQDHTPKIQAAVNGIALSMQTGVTSVNHSISTNQISILPNRTNLAQPNINIYIDGRSAKTDNDLAEVIAHKIYRQMPVVS